jgi:hypothetical protein
MKRLAIALVAVATMGTFVFAKNNSAEPVQTAQEAHATVILEKIQKVDILSQVLPILLTKEQIKKLLPTIEDARQAVADVKKKEYDQLKRLESMLDKVIADGMEKGEVPKVEERKEAIKVINSLAVGRQAVIAINTAKVTAKFNEVANKGQIKTAANSLDPRFFEGQKIEEIPDEKKVEMFCQEVLLHPLAYEMLRKMSL